jgi:hypothetical protein
MPVIALIAVIGTRQAPLHCRRPHQPQKPANLSGRTTGAGGPGMRPPQTLRLSRPKVGPRKTHNGLKFTNHRS